jgi:hypothetical protein
LEVSDINESFRMKFFETKHNEYCLEEVYTCRYTSKAEKNEVNSVAIFIEVFMVLV